MSVPAGRAALLHAWRKNGAHSLRLFTMQRQNRARSNDSAFEHWSTHDQHDAAFHRTVTKQLVGGGGFLESELFRNDRSQLSL